MEHDYNIVNKVVKVSDSSCIFNYLDLVCFMYPDFEIREEFNVLDKNNDIIYVGKVNSNIVELLKENTRNFIAINNIGIQDIDLTIRDVAIKVLYSKYNKSPSDKVKSLLDSMSENDFIKYFKSFWVLGRSKIDDVPITLWDLYCVLGKSRYDILKVYLHMREYYTDSMIFNGVLSFIEKSMNLEDVVINSGKYLKLLVDFNKSFDKVIISVIQKVYTMKCVNDTDREYRTLWLLMQLGKGNIL